MASNGFGKIFKITTWGESHGKAIGVIIDGCLAGLSITIEEINQALALRAPGKTLYTSPRKEKDRAEILSGVFEGKTTGAPISIIIYNEDIDSEKYAPIKDLLRPGHANYTYLEKYGIFDHRGGGRSSARETACRVVAGVFARKILKYQGIHLLAYIKQMNTVIANIDIEDFPLLQTLTYDSPLFCPDIAATESMINLIEKAKIEGDSLGGVVEFIAINMPVGFGDPIYEKLEARLAYAMMSIPATKGFEIGSGFASASMRGSEHNDIFIKKNNKVETQTNHAGGVLGGISNGMPIIGRVAFKPPSSIMKPQKTLTTNGESSCFQLPTGSRHDPCVAIRAVPVVEAMLSLVLVDALLLNKLNHL